MSSKILVKAADLTLKPPLKHISYFLTRIFGLDYTHKFNIPLARPPLPSYILIRTLLPPLLSSSSPRLIVSITIPELLSPEMLTDGMLVNDPGRTEVSAYANSGQCQTLTIRLVGILKSSLDNLTLSEMLSMRHDSERDIVNTLIGLWIG